jgi:hypothetical protein
VAHAAKYRTSYTEEVKRMTDIVPDPYNPDKKTIKDPEKGAEWVERLNNLWQLN